MKTKLEQAEEWAGKLTKEEKKTVFGGQEPNFDSWWPTLSTVDKLYEWNKWKGIVKGSAKPPKKEAPKKTPPKKSSSKKKKK